MKSTLHFWQFKLFALLLSLMLINGSIQAKEQGAYIVREAKAKHPIKHSPYYVGDQIKLDFKHFKIERNALHHYFSNLNPAMVLNKKDIGIYLYDVNGDGLKEIFVMVFNPGYCRENECPFYIFKDLSAIKSGTNILNEFFAKKTKKMRILNSETSKYKDLLLVKEDKYEIWKWDSQSQYKYSGLTDIKHQ